MTTDTALAEDFASARAHLLTVGYRLTGSVSDAEDAVQETWLRLAALPPRQRAQLRDLRAWLTTVVSRICLDRLRSAAARRETYPGQWLPEPLVSSVDSPGLDPFEHTVHDENLRIAALVVLERLTPEQRVAFVLHHGFGVPFGDIAEILDCSQAAARQHGSRGKRALADAEVPPRAEPSTQHDVLERFATAARTGDIRAVAEILAPDAVFVGDSGGKARTARQVVTGADKITRLLLGLLRMYSPEAIGAMRPVLVNGDLGVYVPAAAGTDGYKDLDARVQAMAIRDGAIVAIYDIANPDKLTRIP